MILRLSNSFSRGLIVAAALLVALWLSFFGIRAAIARHAFEAGTAEQLELAVRLEPRNPLYWYRLGHFQQYSLEEANSAKAIASYKKAIALDPVYTDAWLDLGTAYELEGEAQQARESYLQAKKSYPNSGKVFWRYGNFLLRQGDSRQAYAELRRAIEADPHLAATAFSRVYRSNPNIDEILDQVLPPEQGVYVDVISEAAGAKQLAVAQTVWLRLLMLHPRLEIKDVDRLVSGLLAAGEYTEARRAWDQGVARMNLPHLLQPIGSVVWDPSFESGFNGPSFAWRFVPLDQGVRIGFDTTEKLSGNQSLRLSFDGKHNPNLETGCAIGIVQPGTRYLFSGWIKTKEITTDFGIGFRIRPMGSAKSSVVDTRRLNGSNPWTLMEQTWTAGPDVHRVAICVARDPSDNPAGRISGDAWVDDVNLIPQPVEHRKP
jgi:hypothetical protein